MSSSTSIYTTGRNHSRVSYPSRSGLHLSDCHGDYFKVLLCSSSTSEEDNSTWSCTAEKKATKHSGKGNELWLKGVCVQSDALYTVLEGYRYNLEQLSNYSDTITAFYSCIVSNNCAFKINTGCIFSRITHFSSPFFPEAAMLGCFRLNVLIRKLFSLRCLVWFSIPVGTVGIQGIGANTIRWLGTRGSPSPR